MLTLLDVSHVGPKNLKPQLIVKKKKLTLTSLPGEISYPSVLGKHDRIDKKVKSYDIVLLHFNICITYFETKQKISKLNLTIYERFSFKRKCPVVTVGQAEHENLASKELVNFHHRKKTKDISGMSPSSE